IKDLPKCPAGLSLRWYLATRPLHFGIRHNGLKPKQEDVGRSAAVYFISQQLPESPTRTTVFCLEVELKQD
ncbi:MAG: hypothetical protein PWP58_1269, partial [Bacillota bacterium]|nr:hypothetical protein [Bacillota bacterium]